MNERNWPEGKPAWADGYTAGQPVEPGHPNGDWWILKPLVLGRARIMLANADNADIEHWCYDNPIEAARWYLIATEHDVWPRNWTRHLTRNGHHEYPNA